MARTIRQETRLLPQAHAEYVADLTRAAENDAADTEMVTMADRLWLASESEGGTIGIAKLQARAQVELIKRAINLGGRKLGVGPSLFDQLLGSADELPQPEPPKPSAADIMTSLGPRLFEVQPVTDLGRNIAEAANKPVVKQFLDGMDGYGLDTSSRVH